VGKYDALLGQFWWSEYAQGQFDEYVSPGIFAILSMKIYGIPYIKHAFFFFYMSAQIGKENSN
jgi:hypothetical protein